VAVVLLSGAGVVAKAIDPRGAFTYANAVVGDRWVAAGLVLVAVGAEAALATAAILDLVDRVAVLFAGALLMTAMAAWLAYGTFVAGVTVPCGCLPGLRNVVAEQAMLIDMLVAAEFVVVGLVGRGSESRQRTSLDQGPAPPPGGAMHRSLDHGR
jgi:hypothetical protein